MPDQAFSVHVSGVTTPGLFTGPESDPLQVVRVRIRRTRPAGPLRISVRGQGVTTPRPRLLRADTAEAYAGVDAKAELGGGARQSETSLESWAEVPVRIADAAPGDRLPATAHVHASDGRLLASYDFELTVAEPGWTVRLVPHFHYDPMWWNTQAAYTALWDTPQREGEPEKGWEYTGVPAFTLVPLHLQQAADDPSYRFVLSEIDYLKPFWDTHPEHREEIRQLIREGRLEIVGGTYNEPSTNLTSAETTVRGAVHGLGFHRDVLGGNPRTAWQLDVFGHDPSFPSLMADAGLDSAVFARGPHHQWGPMMDTWGEALRPPSAMQLPAEYDWIGPSGSGLLLHYLPAHYSAGWFSHKAASSEAAAGQLLDLYELLRTGAATRNVLIPMGTDFSWPHPWGLDVQHAWNRRYTWPRMEHSGPRQHFAAVRAELEARGERPLPVTREMGPVYTGKDVTYADVKQAHRAAEYLVQEAETYASLVHALGLMTYPADALDKAWRHLLHAAHHDAVTGTFSDQVYLDLLPTWREAYELADSVRESALSAMAAAVDTRVPAAGESAAGDKLSLSAQAGAAAGGVVAVTVFNPVSWDRTDVVRTSVALDALGVADAAWIGVRGEEGGAPAPVLVEHVHDGVARIAFLAREVPSLGHRTWWLAGTDGPVSAGWVVASEAAVDGGAGWAVASEAATGRGTGRATESGAAVDGDAGWTVASEAAGDGGAGRATESGAAVDGDAGWAVASEAATGRGTGCATESGAAVDGDAGSAPSCLRIANGMFLVEADPSRGGGLSRVADLRSGRELITPGEVDELVVQDEYAAHPFFEEGPWHLLPKGPGTGSGAAPAESVAVEHSPLGARIVARGRTGPVRWTRTTTLWEGLDRVELTTRVDEFEGSDQLLRLRIPADVPGALPVAETAAAAVGRGFAFPETDTGVDHTRAPWTLDTPCLNWFALSSTLRVALTGPEGTRVGERPLGAGEIVLPDAGLPGYGQPMPPGAEETGGPSGGGSGSATAGTQKADAHSRAATAGAEKTDDRTGSATAGAQKADAHSRPTTTAPSAAPSADGPGAPLRDPLRDLVTALVQHGVTTTPTRARGPRWGDLAVDSSLPDFRIALGGPEVNSFTAAVLSAAPAAYTKAVRDRESPLVLVPAQAPLREVWQPGCDLTGPRDLPVLALTGDALPGALAAPAETVRRDAALGALAPEGAAEPFEDRTVGVLVRGTPSFAIDTEGRLHSTLMRSCTGRPSAEWMDPPRRTAPDGSSFQLQHWTHVFEHALVASEGDWREADLLRRGREFNQPLTAVTGTLHDGPAPRAMSHLSVEPSRQVLVETVKKTEDGEAFAVRLRETHGRAVRPTLIREMVVVGAERTGLLEEPSGDERLAANPPDDVFDLSGNAYATVRLTSEPSPGTEPLRESVQPVFSRYWLHNTGTAPLGNAPYSVRVMPYALTAEGSEPLRTEVALTSNSRDAAGDCPVDVLLPEGWSADWTRGTVRIDADGHTRLPLTVRPAPDAESGDHLVRVVMTTPAGAVEDCLTVTVPGRSGPPPGISVEAETTRVDLTPGGRGEVAVLVHNGLHSDLHGEALAVSPYGSWQLTGQRTVLQLAARDTTRTVFELSAPVDTPPGVYWVLIKAVCQGRIAYGPAVAVRVGQEPHRQDGTERATAPYEGKAR
ncbi:NEW3 domain-containing protein [Streptomyces sp. N35]|uniref:glycoside hydrolase family 38 N-terminal domain-containing protein n=1 Tax=Streptomyces sp. N35 TaxID=2795730 RepID=UPI0018F27C16|nr:NEW3 domain-containing protein [Streptomyces sp. N35]